MILFTVFIGVSFAFFLLAFLAYDMQARNELIRRLQKKIGQDAAAASEPNGS